LSGGGGKPSFFCRAGVTRLILNDEGRMKN
jgi:hypothetical protein